ncbi:MAG: PAS domain-containing protein [Lacunisphaera sp.]
MRQSEQLYRAIGDSINYGVWVCDAQGRNLYASDSFLKLTGVTQGAVRPSRLDRRASTPTDVAATTAAWAECVRTGEFWEREHRFKGVDGQYHPVLARGVPIRDDAGLIIRWVGINLDIAAYKQSQDTARKRMEALEQLNEVGSKLVAEHDLEKIVQLVTDTGRETSGAAFGAFFYNVLNEQGESYTLYTLSACRGTPLPNFPCRAPRRCSARPFAARASCASPTCWPIRATAAVRRTTACRPATCRCAATLAAPVTSRNGEVLGGLFFGHPGRGRFHGGNGKRSSSRSRPRRPSPSTTPSSTPRCRGELEAQRRSEARLRDSETRWRQLAEAMPHLVWTCTPDGQCDYLSPQWITYTGLPELDQLGLGWLERVHPDDKAGLMVKWTDATASGHVFDTEFRIRRADGKFRLFKARAVPVRDTQGRIVKWYGSNTDVEEFRRIEQAVRKSEHQLRLVTDHAPVYLVQCNLDHCLQVREPSLCRALRPPAGKHHRPARGRDRRAPGLRHVQGPHGRLSRGPARRVRAGGALPHPRAALGP